jgi:hypothetical protein
MRNGSSSQGKTTVKHTGQKKGDTLFRVNQAQAEQFTSPDKIRGVVTVIWWAILCTLPIYAAVPYLIHREGISHAFQTHAPSVAPGVLLLPLWCITVFEILLSALLPSRLRISIERRLSNWAEQESPVSKELLCSILFQGEATLAVLMAALGESIAIYGLILGVLGAPPRLWLPFFAVSLFHMLWQKSKHPSNFARAEEKAQEISAGYISR